MARKRLKLPPALDRLPRLEWTRRPAPNAAEMSNPRKVYSIHSAAVLVREFEIREWTLIQDAKARVATGESWNIGGWWIAVFMLLGLIVIGLAAIT